MENVALIERIARIAKTIGVSKYRVHFDFRIFSEEDGGPAWSIYATVPAVDKRKVDRPLHGAGASLEEAETGLMESFERAKARGDI
jgi:hypothetical protein